VEAISDDPSPQFHLRKAALIDTLGYPHVFYGGDYLRHAFRDATGWHREILDAEVGTGWDVAAALDGQGRIHVSYAYRYLTSGQEWYRSQLKQAVNTNGTWQIERVDCGPVGGETSIAIDPAGATHIIYLDDFCDVKHVSNASGTYVTEHVAFGDGGQCEAPANALALDSDGHAHVLTFPIPGDFDSLVRYMTNESGTWVAEVLREFSASEAGSPSIAVDHQNRVHIMYFDPENLVLRHGTRDAGIWSYETVDADAPAGLDIDLRLGSDDTLHVSYWGSGALKYASGKTGAWNLETITDNLGDYGGQSALALGPTSAFVAYHDWTTHTFKIATKESGAWTSDLLDTSDVDGSTPSIALDPAGHAYVAHQDVLRLCLVMTTNASGEWKDEPIDCTQDAGYDASTKVDKDGKVHVLFWAYALHTRPLMHATNASGIWVLEQIDSSVAEDTPSAMAIDSEGHLHVIYEFTYATNSSGSWLTQVIDPDCFPESAMPTQGIALGASGAIHVGYSCVSETLGPVIRHATLRGGTWTVEDVETMGCGPLAGCAQAQMMGMALDGSETPWFVYWADANVSGQTPTPGFVLAGRVAGSWVRETHDVPGGRGRFSFAVAADGTPHIAVKDWDRNDLLYFTKVSGAWQSVVVDSEGVVGDSPNLILGPDGKPQIVYLDSSTASVHYAKHQ
jgi:hypothetical protein